MLNKVLLAAVFVYANIAHTQTIHRTMKSSNFKEERELKIQLPRNYEDNKNKSYPIIVVLDGDYLFEPMAGNIDYYSYWDEIPEAIVIGINQFRDRENDSYYDDENHLPFNTGAAFFEFIGMELLPYIDQNYRTTNFAAIAGHDLTANFSNYYLFKEQPLFQAYINLSPDLAPQMADRLYGSLSRTTNKTWFYLATASEDIPDLRNGSLQLDEDLRSIENDNFNYAFDDFEDANHYTFIARALPKAIESIFHSYRPITNKEYEENIVTADSPYGYLRNKYETIRNSFGIDISVRINDFLAVGKALEEHQNWKELEELGQLARDQVPASIIGTYYLARAYEENGEAERAVRTYKSSFDKEEVAFLTVDYMLERAERIENEFSKR